MRDCCDVTLIIDRSGSMANMGNGVVDGVNSFIDEQKKSPGEVAWSLVLFDDPGSAAGAGEAFPNVVFTATGAPHLETGSFCPRGNTALFDAVCDTIEATGRRFEAMAEADRPDKVVFVVMTDGLNNASTRHTREKMNEMISRQRSSYNWKFVFLACGQDAMKTGAGYGIAGVASNAYIPGYAGSAKVLKTAGADLLRWRDDKDTEAEVELVKDDEAIAHPANQ